MALISTKNIVAPFTNKTNLVTLILVVVAFLFFRLAGGEVDIVNASEDSVLTERSSNSNSRYKDNQKSETKKDQFDSPTRSLEDIEQMFQ